MTKPEITLTHEFVGSFPDQIKDGTLYVSVTFASAVHKCCCGCGSEIVTPLTPTDWRMIFDGETISLEPSIGNWSFPCQSHYWIKRNQVRWAGAFSEEKVKAVRELDSQTKHEYFAPLKPKTERTVKVTKAETVSKGKKKKGILKKLKRMLGGD
jgi:hypothetical protein